ncbi:uncharacterized protein [Apostichopus japonicus]|uniref:uncharacterized protein isoform X2 n=1 Tax=Stichopus japonicus TaxID=307972 RepID=UPI003AB2DB04
MAVAGMNASRRLLRLQRMLLPAARSHRSLEVIQKPVTQTVYLSSTHTCQENDIPYPLTEDEAFWFLQNVLAMDKPQELLRKDRCEFLDSFTHLMNVKIPFTNIHILAGQDLTSLTCPTLQECKEAMMKCYGGNCVYINIFSKALLDVLGFKTFHVGANNPGEALFDSHVSTIVSDLSHPGSQHLVDPGTIRPLFEAIPLDFEKESPVYQFNYIKVKFFKRDHGILLSCSQVPRPEKASPSVFEDKGSFWKVELVYRLRAPRSRAYWLNRMKYRYCFPTMIPHIFHNIGVFGYVNDKCVIIGSVGDMFALKYQHSDPSQAEMMFLPKDEFLELMGKEFPQFTMQMIENALVNANYVRNIYNY